ncbi:MAG TPA: 50S ribosomal protein L21 [Ktedonobacteraceae bacterium]|nr:50S ribosomal protein L21 [Ktedonobacteraceae bacterium]
MFAVIKSGGRQYKVSVGEQLEVNRLPVEEGAQVEIGEVLLISDADQTMIGAPFVDNAKVVATVGGHPRGKKLIVFKYKSKKRYRHRRGHRQELTVLTIDDIIANGKSLVTGEAPRMKEDRLELEEGEAPQATAEPAEAVQETPATEGEKKARRRRSAKAEATESETEE